MRVAVGVLGPERLGVQLEDEVVRRVLDPLISSSIDIALGLQVALAQQRRRTRSVEDSSASGKVRRRARGPGSWCGRAPVKASSEPPRDLERQRDLLARSGARCP